LDKFLSETAIKHFYFAFYMPEFAGFTISLLILFRSLSMVWDISHSQKSRSSLQLVSSSYPWFWYCSYCCVKFLLCFCNLFKHFCKLCLLLVPCAADSMRTEYMALMASVHGCASFFNCGSAVVNWGRCTGDTSSFWRDISYTFLQSFHTECLNLDITKQSMFQFLGDNSFRMHAWWSA